MRVVGRSSVRASTRVGAEETIEIEGGEQYVSRAAHKLVAALDGFDVDPRGQLVLDVGASTGGFTQVALLRGAREVIALDVGHGQLAPALRADARVRVVEGANARELTERALAELSGTPERPGLVVGDLSFISLRTVLPALVGAVGPAAAYLLLVKPQFEVGRTGIREGIVRDPALRARALRDVLLTAWELGLGTAGVLSSPLLGTEGNSEFLVHLSGTSGSHPTEWEAAITELAG